MKHNILYIAHIPNTHKVAMILGNRTLVSIDIDDGTIVSLMESGLGLVREIKACGEHHLTLSFHQDPDLEDCDASPIALFCLKTRRIIRQRWFKGGEQDTKLLPGGKLGVLDYYGLLISWNLKTGKVDPWPKLQNHDLCTINRVNPTTLVAMDLEEQIHLIDIPTRRLVKTLQLNGNVEEVGVVRYYGHPILAVVMNDPIDGERLRFFELDGTEVTPFTGIPPDRRVVQVICDYPDQRMIVTTYDDRDNQDRHWAVPWLT